jgi:site-specific DNA-methyltransferase (adenine-specific)
VLFKETSAGSSPAQIEAFEDTWHWGESAQQAFEQVALHGTDDTARLLKAMVDALGHNDVTAYLSMMAVRLIELRGVLKPTGSIYLHCDPTASHYLKVLMDSIFGPKNYRNEITWLRHEGHSDAKRFGSVHDVILYYQRELPPTFRTIRGAYSDAQLSRYKYEDEGGPYRAENLTAAGASPNRTIEWRGVNPGANRHWMWSIAIVLRVAVEDKDVGIHEACQ